MGWFAQIHRTPGTRLLIFFPSSPPQRKRVADNVAMESKEGKMGSSNVSYLRHRMAEHVLPGSSYSSCGRGGGEMGGSK